jgi:hypothetical protein
MRGSRFLPLAILAAACGDDAADDWQIYHPDEWEEITCRWQDQVDGPAEGRDGAIDVAITTDAGLVVAGAIEDAGDEAMWLRRYSSTGEVLWTRQGSGDSVSGAIGAVAVAADHRVAVTGKVEETAGREDFWIAEYDQNGEHGWSIDLDSGGAGADACFAPDGALYVTGTVLDPDIRSGTLIWVGKLASDGALLWSRTDPGNHPGRENRGRKILCDADGGVTVLASIYEPGGPDSIGPATHTWVRRYDGAGDARWTTTIGVEFEDSFPFAILVDPAANGLLVGSGRQYHHLDPADGSATATDLPAPPVGPVLATDAGGTYVHGGFGEQIDPDCDEDTGDDCPSILYWGYAYFDWAGDLVWWRATTSGVPDDTQGAVQAVASADDALVVVGSRQGDVWVCYE